LIAQGRRSGGDRWGYSPGLGLAGDAEGGALQRYEVPARENQTVLDVVTHIQRELDPTLAYRFACRWACAAPAPWW
jgi:hypothetical protein